MGLPAAGFRAPPARRLQPPTGDAFGCDVGDVVAIHQGPNSDLYYADISTNKITELRYDPGTNQPPVAKAVVDPTASGDLSTNFRFDASASFDTEGDPLTFAWAFGDGTTATGAVVTHRYDHHADFTATVTVSDNHGGVSSFTLPVSTNHTVPTLTITPNKSGPYSVGDTGHDDGHGQGRHQPRHHRQRHHVGSPAPPLPRRRGHRPVPHPPAGRAAPAPRSA